jgi:acyl-CoA synthetase (AMP-forming)/AMP-acid ligase II
VDLPGNLIQRVNAGDSLTRSAAAHPANIHSGDAGRFDGVLWFADRYKDVIETGGESVASIEVEKAVPKSVIVVEQRPKTSTGKIQKNRLREDHTSHYEG